ncbi:MAG: hypothetical protein ABIR52_01760 [Casimicrobiaceae bacterium]
MSVGNVDTTGREGDAKRPIELDTSFTLPHERGGPRYLVIYEVDQLAALTSDAYLQRLNNPRAWTSKMMPHYRGMTRGLCSVSGSFGSGMGGVCVLFRFMPVQGSESSLRRWLCEDTLPGIPARPGLGSVHLLEGASTPVMTNEQRIRGADAGIHWALLVTGYSGDALAQLNDAGSLNEQLSHHGAVDILDAQYQLAYSLAAHGIDT